jgi:hypothetical protein
MPGFSDRASAMRWLTRGANCLSSHAELVSATISLSRLIIAG